MKSRTLMEVVQSPGRKAFQQSPASACFRRAALAFMVALPSCIQWLLWRASDRSRTVAIRACDDPSIVALALRRLTGIGEHRMSRTIDLDQSSLVNGAPDPKDPERHHDRHTSRFSRDALSQQI